MKIKRETVERTTEEHTLTPEFCYEQAAQILFANPTDYLQRPTTESIAQAAEWRQLGDSLARMVGAS